MKYNNMMQMVSKFRNKYKGKLVANNVRVFMEGDEVICVRLHKTNIVKFFPCGLIQLDSGGWDSHTTKKRINEYLPSGYGLYQKNFEWFLTTPHGVREFKDGMKIYNNVLQEVYNAAS